MESSEGHAPPTHPSIRRLRFAIVACIAVGLLLLVVLSTSGYAGVVTSQEGGVFHYRTSVTMALIIMLPLLMIGVMGGLIALVPHRPARLLGAAALILSVYGLATAPSVLGHRMTLTPEGLTQKAGFWYSPIEHRFQFDELQMIKVHRWQKRRGPPEMEFQFHRRNGSVETMPKSSFLEAALPKLREFALAKNVPVVIRDGDSLQ